MKNMRLCVMIGLAFVAASRAAAEERPTRDEQKLESSASDLDKEAAEPGGPKRVEDKLEARFHVDDKRIDALRAQKLGYGEIAIALALAQKLPGGINDANVSKILAERQGPPVMGWGRIAKKEGVSLGKVLSDVRRADESVRGRDRDERAGHERGEKAEHPEHPERAERPERQERQERTERPENPRH